MIYFDFTINGNPYQSDNYVFASFPMQYTL